MISIWVQHPIFCRILFSSPRFIYKIVNTYLIMIWIHWCKIKIPNLLNIFNIQNYQKYNPCLVWDSCSKTHLKNKTSCKYIMQQLPRPWLWYFFLFFYRAESEWILASRVNDGICDCCDGSDEWKSSQPLGQSTLSRQKQEKLHKYQTPCQNICS